MWGAKNQSMVNPQCTLPDTEMYLYKAPVGRYSSWESYEWNNQRSDQPYKNLKEIGIPTKLIIDTEAYIMTAKKMEGVYGIPRDTISIKNELQQVLHLVGKPRIVDGIK